MFPLALLNCGECGEIERIIQNNACEALDSCLKNVKRVEELGLRNGKCIQVLRNDKSHAVVVKIDNSRIALDRNIAMKIMVRRIK